MGKKSNKPSVTYSDKLKRANKEAAYTLIAVAVIIVAWILLGFGLAAFDIQICSTPVWIIGGTIGVWVVAIIVCVVMKHSVFEDFSFEDCDGGSASGAPTDGEPASVVASGAPTDGEPADCKPVDADVVR